MLKQIADDIRKKVALDKVAAPIKDMVIHTGKFALSKAIKKSEWALIAECKLASPAKGLLCQTHSVPELARIFTSHGACALSVHTSAPFLGKLTDIAAVKAVTPLPVLRKDFIIDEYQIYEASSAGADAILLIAAILSDEELEHFLAVSRELGLDALVEVHSLPELKRVQATSAELVGINNRDLTTFNTSVNTTFALLPHCDPQRLLISESGIHDKTEALRLKSTGVRGILVGEGLVRAPDIAHKTRELSLLQNGLEE